MAERCPNANYLGSTELKDWRLIFKSVATIEKDLGKYVVDTTALMQDLRKLKTIERVS